MRDTNKRKPRGLASTGAAFKNDYNRRNDRDIGGFVKPSRIDRRNKRGGKRGR